MKIRSLLRPLLLALIGPALAASARAHFVWLERDDAGTTAAYFGEWSDNVRETQDGYLRLIAAPKAFASDGRALPVEIKHDRLAVAADASAGDIRLTNAFFPEKGTTLVQYHARLGRTDTAAHLPLELVPVAAEGNMFTLSFRGQPLADTEVTLFTSSGWNRKFKTGADGRVTLQTPWSGPAVAEVTHVEKTKGDHAGRAYEAIRHVATLSFAVPAR